MDIKTTQETLQDYIQKKGYHTTYISVPNKSGCEIFVYYWVKKSSLSALAQNQQHAFVEFSDYDSLEKLMRDRPHLIDGKEVFVHRHIRTNQNLKGCIGSTSLLVKLSSSDRSINQSMIENQFRGYGHINYIEVLNHGNFTEYTIIFNE